MPGQKDYVIVFGEAPTDVETAGQHGVNHRKSAPVDSGPLNGIGGVWGRLHLGHPFKFVQVNSSIDVYRDGGSVKLPNQAT